MTIAVGVARKNEVVLAADSQSSFGTNTVATANHRAQKIRKIGSAYIAMSGWGVYQNIFDDFLLKHDRFDLNSEQEIFVFFNNFWRELKENYCFVNEQCDRSAESPFVDLDSSFLIASKSGIFYVCSNMSITRFDQYFAIGSGCNFALGALHALYDSALSASKIAVKAVEAAMSLNVYCGGEIHLKRIRR